MRNLSGNKGKIIGIVIVCILIVASIATYALANRNKKAENTNETVVEATTEIKTETLETEKIEETETAEEETEENNSIDIDYVAAFTCTDTDEESLIGLVKNTVNYTKIQLDYNLTESKLYTPVLSKALDSFTQTKTGAIDANSTFDYGENGNPCATANPETDSWTYNDVAGMIGYFIFTADGEHNSIDYMQAQTSDFLKEFLINDFYHADANSFSNFELSGVTGETFNKSNYPMEVNYKLQFKYNGQIYTAGMRTFF